MKRLFVAACHKLDMKTNVSCATRIQENTALETVYFKLLIHYVLLGLWTSARGDVSNLRWDQTGQHVNSEYFGEIRNWHGHGSRCGVLSSDFKYLDTNDCNTRHFFLCQKFL